MVRIFFKSKGVRKEFFEKLFRESSFKTWKNLYEFYKIPRSVFDCYKNGKISIHKELYEKLSIYFSNKDREYFSKRIKLVEDNWGKVKGGNKAYAKNKEIFDTGRKKGMLKILKIREGKNFDYNEINLDKDLAYFIGLLIGDGFLNEYSRHYLIQFIGHKNHELDYYKNVVCPYFNKKFNLNPIIKESKIGNFIRVNIYSKNLFDLLTKKFNFPKGRKSHTITIPPKILISEKEILLSCIAGIYDAEGCIFFDKRKTYSKPYPRIDLHMLNLAILNQIKKILDEEGIICSIANSSNDNSRILVYGEKNVRIFLKKIHIKNPKHINKLKEHNVLH